jgi:hypothetical protein
MIYANNPHRLLPETKEDAQAHAMHYMEIDFDVRAPACSVNVPISV